MQKIILLPKKNLVERELNLGRFNLQSSTKLKIPIGGSRKIHKINSIIHTW